MAIGQRTRLYESTRSLIWKVEPSNKSAFVSKDFKVSDPKTSLEIDTHSSVSHIPSVTRVLGKVTDVLLDHALFLEYCEYGSLRSYLERGPISNERLLSWFRSMALTVRLIHEKRIVHRVLSVDNWLVTRDLQVKLTDFGHAKAIRLGESEHLCSLRDEQGQPLDEQSNRIFSEDGLRLARTFYQMATRDFDAQVLSLSEEEIRRGCADYDWQVANTIFRLLELGGVAHQVDVERILRKLESPLGRDEPMSLVPLQGIICDVCERIKPPHRSFPCEHKLCADCESCLTERHFSVECEFCKKTYSDSQQVEPMDATNKYNFSSVIDSL